MTSGRWGSTGDCNLNVSVCRRGRLDDQVLWFFLTVGVTLLTVI